MSHFGHKMPCLTYSWKRQKSNFSYQACPLAQIKRCFLFITLPTFKIRKTPDEDRKLVKGVLTKMLNLYSAPRYSRH